MTSASRDPDLVRIGAVIRDKRQRRGEKQHVVAERAGIHPASLKNIEHGRKSASREMYIRIADALDMTVEDMDELTGQGVQV